MTIVNLIAAIRSSSRSSSAASSALSPSWCGSNPPTGRLADHPGDHRHRDPKVVRALHGALSQVELEPTRARPVGVSPFIRFLEPVAVEIVAGRTGGAPIRLRLAPDSRLDLGATEVSPGAPTGTISGPATRTSSATPRVGRRWPSGRARSRPAGPAQAAQPADPQAQDHRPASPAG